MLQVVAFAVGSPQLVNGVESLRQVALKIFVGAVFLTLEFLHPLADQHGDKNNQRVKKQNQQPQLPVHPDEHTRRACDGQAGHNKPADRCTQKLIDGVQIGDEVAGDTA